MRACVREIEKWQRRFFFATFVAIVLSVLQFGFELEFLRYPRATSWVGAGVCSIYEGRARRRLGEDAAPAVLRGMTCIAVAVLALI